MPSASQTPPEPGMPDLAARRQAMAWAGAATADELRDALAQAGALPEAEDLRAPETGLVMVRGRIGGDGRAFNAANLGIGEAALAQLKARFSAGQASRFAAIATPTWPCCAVSSGAPCGGLLILSPADRAMICAWQARSRK